MNILFQNPAMFWGLSAIAIPIIVHLFKFRKIKIVYFSNTDLLRQLQNETVSRTKLKHLLILLARILALISLVLAFTMPFIPPNISKSFFKSKQLVAIYIDNSFSMTNEGREGQLLEEAKKRALDIVKAYSPETKFIIQDNDNKPSNHFLLSRDKASEVIKSISPSAVSLSLSTVRNTITTVADNNEIGAAIRQYYISDFQKNMFDIQFCKADSMSRWTWIPLEAQTVDNIFIDSCWFETPSRQFRQPEKLFVKIVNASDKSYNNLPLKLYLNDTVKALSNFKLKPHESTTLTLDYNNSFHGIVKGKLEITDYPVIFDNSYYFTYEIKQKNKVLVIQANDRNKYLDALLKSDETIVADYADYTSLNYSSLPDYNTIILSGLPNISEGLAFELRKSLSINTSIIIFPEKKISVDSYNIFLQSCKAPLFTNFDTTRIRTKALDYKHPVFSNVFKSEIENADLPIIFMHYKTTIPSRSATNNIMWAENGDNIVSSTQVSGNGNLYLFTTPNNPEANTLVKHPVFVPLILKMIMNSTISGSLQYKIGNQNSITIKAETGDKTMLLIVNAKQKIEFIPQQTSDNNRLFTKIFLGQSVSEAGYYDIKSGSEIIGSIACNYDRKESTMEFYDKGKITELASQTIGETELISSPRDLTGDSIKKMSKGTQLWKWFVWSCLAFVLAEILLIRFYK